MPAQPPHKICVNDVLRGWMKYSLQYSHVVRVPYIVSDVDKVANLGRVDLLEFGSNEHACDTNQL